MPVITLNETTEALILIGERMIDPKLHAVAGGIAAVYSTTSPDKETMNEDAVAVIPIDDASAVFAVADGLGGTRLGGEAAKCAILALKTTLAEAIDSATDLQSAILGSIEKANESILNLGTGAATTLAVAEVHGNMVRPYHVGDSVILVFGQRGKIKMQTVAHSPVGFALEAGMLSEKEAMFHEDRNIVSNVIGAANTRIEIGMPLKMAARDTLLLASDGLMDNLHVGEVISRLRKGPIAKAADALVRDSRKRMMNPADGKPSHPDDLTFVAFRQQTYLGKNPA
ncbi:MAG: protein phosphatase 2C domain-containing protein, partial [Planctomycetes bacterium]|nr:protein phosphatase 2C domain-containing protein [Planctomycetota bacterium]